MNTPQLVSAMREVTCQPSEGPPCNACLNQTLAADLLQMHLSKSLSLDHWATASEFVRAEVIKFTGNAAWELELNHA